MFSSLTSQEIQSFVFLTILLSLFVSQIIFSKHLKIKTVIKYFLLWSLFTLGIVALYSYRYEFKNLKNKILAELNPSSATKENERSFSINISKDGHFYLDVLLNDVPVRFMIDTGASDIAIDKKIAKKIGIDLDNLSFNKEYKTANGVSYGADIVIKKLDVANLSFKNIHASVNSSDLDTPLLGMSFLKHFAKYEFYQDKLYLFIDYQD